MPADGQDADQAMLDRLRLPDVPGAAPGPVTTNTKQRHQQFVKFPRAWVDRLQRASYTSTYRVALHLLFHHWKSDGCPIRLSNVALAEAGVSRDQKWRALRELECLGLIRIERRRRRSPMITLLII
jgi:hypothetical protein